MEVEYETTVRLAAPVEAVWGKISALDLILRHFPQVAVCKMDLDGRRAQVAGRVDLGPLHLNMEGTAALVEVTAPHRLVWKGSIPGYQLEFRGDFEVVPGANDQTHLTYHGRLDCHHPVIGRLREALTNTLEDHVNGLASRVTTLAVQHTLAEQRLRFRTAPESP